MNEIFEGKIERHICHQLLDVPNLNEGMVEMWAIEICDNEGLLGWDYWPTEPSARNVELQGRRKVRILVPAEPVDGSET